MTWGWSFCKGASVFVMQVAILSNPFGSIIGGVGTVFSKAAILTCEDVLNDCDSKFDDKVRALSTIELMTEYCNSVVLGVVGKGIGALGSLSSESTTAAQNVVISTSKETAVIGKMAAKEIAQHGGKTTPLARDLISLGRHLSVVEKASIISAAEKAAERALQESANASFNSFKELLGKAFDSLCPLVLEKIGDHKSGENFSKDAIALLGTMRATLLSIIENHEDTKRGDLNSYLESLHKINRENVSVRIKKGKDNLAQHLEIDQEINQLIRIVKENRK